MSPKNKHDQLFKKIFSSPAAAKDLVLAALSERIINYLDLESLKLEKDSYVDEHLQEYFADLVFSCRVLNSNHKIKVSLILEHKSYKESFPHIQLLKYLVNAYDRQLGNRIKQKKLTPTIPIIFYHGKGKWKLFPFDHSFNLPSADFKKYVPDFHYDLFDLNSLSDQKIKQFQTGFAITTLLIMKHRLDKKYLMQQKRELFIFIEDINRRNSNEWNYVKAILHYFINSTELTTENIRNMINDMPDNVQEEVKTTYDYILEEGIEKGGALKAVKIALQLLDSQTDAQVTAITELDIEFIRDLRLNRSDNEALISIIQSTFGWPKEEVRGII